MRLRVLGVVVEVGERVLCVVVGGSFDPLTATAPTQPSRHYSRRAPSLGRHSFN